MNEHISEAERRAQTGDLAEAARYSANQAIGALILSLGSAAGEAVSIVEGIAHPDTVPPVLAMTAFGAAAVWGAFKTVKFTVEAASYQVRDSQRKALSAEQ